MSLSFSALEVGQGDAFLLEKEGWNCLFDSGGSKKGLVSLLKKKKIQLIQHHLNNEPINATLLENNQHLKLHYFHFQE